MTKDDQHAYFCSRKCHKVVGVDVKTFQAAPVTSNWANARVYARDKNSTYKIKRAGAPDFYVYEIESGEAEQ